MTRQLKVTAAAAALAIVAITGSMVVRHQAEAPSVVNRADLTAEISSERIARALDSANVQVDNLMVRSAGGIVILRGHADAATSEQAANVVRSLGAVRVANLITPTRPIDDDSIRRAAERQLATHGALQGASFHVSCEKGVLNVTGTVTHELQKDAARSILRSVRGAQGVNMSLEKL
jgi:osmotically-inducible protein OsmY